MPEQNDPELFLCRGAEHTPGFPSGSVVKNLLVNAGDTGSIPGLGRSHMPQSNQVHVLQQEKLPQGAARAPQLEKSPRGNKDPAQTKVRNKLIVFYIKIKSRHFV